jgi:hypothetical protein
MKTQDMIILALAAIALWMLMGKRASFADVMNAPAAAANAVAAAAPAVAEAPGAASSAASSAGNLEVRIQKIFSDMAAGVKQALGGSKSSFVPPCPCGM